MKEPTNNITWQKTRLAYFLLFYCLPYEGKPNRRSFHTELANRVVRTKHVRCFLIFPVSVIRLEVWNASLQPFSFVSFLNAYCARFYLPDCPSFKQYGRRLDLQFEPNRTYRKYKETSCMFCSNSHISGKFLLFGSIW